MNKLFSTFFIIVLLIPFIFSSSLGISPTTIKFYEKQNEVICKNFSILGNEENILNGEIEWSRENNKDVSKYILSSNDLEINIDFPIKVKKGEYQICIYSEREGKTYGILTYKLENSSYAIGTWIELEVAKNNLQNVLPLTGDSIKNLDYKKIFFLTPLLFIIILVFLLLKLKRNNIQRSKNI
jgi:hypothetical protein